MVRIFKTIALYFGIVELLDFIYRLVVEYQLFSCCEIYDIDHNYVISMNKTADHQFKPMQYLISVFRRNQLQTPCDLGTTEYSEDGVF